MSFLMQREWMSFENLAKYQSICYYNIPILTFIYQSYKEFTSLIRLFFMTTLIC